MSDKKFNLEKLGYILSCLGGFLVIVSLTRMIEDSYGLEISMLAAFLAILGLFLIGKGKVKRKQE